MRVFSKIEAWAASVASRLQVLAALPPRVRALVLQVAVAVLLLALGVVIGRTLAWVLIAVAVTVIVVFAGAGFAASREPTDSKESPPKRPRPPSTPPKYEGQLGQKVNLLMGQYERGVRSPSYGSERKRRERLRRETSPERQTDEPSPQLSFGRALLPKRSQPIRVQDDKGQWYEVARGRVIRVPVTNALGAGEAKGLHARLHFRTSPGTGESQFAPPTTQGEWPDERGGLDVEIDLPGNGRPRSIDVVVVLDGQHPHAHEWTTQSRAAGLRGYAIKAGSFGVEIELMAIGLGAAAPYLKDTLQIDCVPGSGKIRANWLSRSSDEPTNWVAWN